MTPPRTEAGSPPQGQRCPLAAALARARAPAGWGLAPNTPDHVWVQSQNSVSGLGGVWNPQGRRKGKGQRGRGGEAAARHSNAPGILPPLSVRFSSFSARSEPVGSKSPDRRRARAGTARVHPGRRGPRKLSVRKWRCE